MPPLLESQLESLVDQHGLAAVLESLSMVCAGKSDHIAENWQDKHLANAWERAAYAVQDVSFNPAVKAVSL